MSMESRQVEALRDFVISQQFVDASNEAIFNEQINMLQEARDKAVSVTVAVDEISLTPLIRYHDMLSVIVPKLKGYEASLPFEFSWVDPLDKRKRSCKASCLYYEWSNVLWNIAAFSSFIGAKIDRSSAEGIKKACKCFQVAAGIIEYISKETLCHINLPVGEHVFHLTHEAQAIAKNLMLSQAQLCFYEMAVKEKKAGNMKASIVAKIACQTSNFFGVTKLNCEDDSLQMLLDPMWKSYCDFNVHLFAAAADYWQSQVAKDASVASGRNYGEEVARLGTALKIKAAVKISSEEKLTTAISQSAYALYKVIENSYVAAEEDNRTIYMSPLPTESELAPVEGVAMVRPASSLPTSISNDSEDALAIKRLFSFVIPSDLRMKILDVQTRADDMVREINRVSCEATNDVRARLGSLGCLELWRPIKRVILEHYQILYGRKLNVPKS